jgi:hypothetical protein
MLGFHWQDQPLLAFVDRLKRDSEFREWFARAPGDALASQGLYPSDLSFLDQVVATDRSQRALADALRPFLSLLVEVVEACPANTDETCARLDAELATLGLRLAAAREQERVARPWWRFWG